VSGQVLTRKQGDLAILTLEGPSGNALTHSLRAALADALCASIADAAIRAIILEGAGIGFSSGSDLSELDSAPASPHLRDLCTLIEEAPKPVICALHGAVIGGGMELALAAHGRVTRRGTRLAIPDVRLALIPGAGATQRLPRILGAQRAAQFLLSGQSVLAEDAAMKRLFHRITEDAPLESALALARSYADRKDWPRTREDRRGFSDPGGYAASIAALRAQLPSGPGVAQDILRAIEVAPLFPFKQGLAFEAALFEDRVTAPDCRAARHALRCERQAAVQPSGIVPEMPSRIVIIGTAPVACQIAAALLETRAEICLLAASDAALDQARAAISQQLRASLPEETANARLGRLRLETGPGGLAQADLVLDSGEGALDPKMTLKPGVIWAGLSAGLTPQRVAGKVSRGRFMTLCPHPPVGRGGVAEICCSGQTDPQGVANLQACLSAIDIQMIRTSLQAGALGHRMRMSLSSAACLLVAHGADPYGVDEAALACGFAQGPLQSMDAHGLHHVMPPLAQFARARSLVDVSQGMLQALCDKGRTGKAAGRGIYIHAETGPMRDPALPSLLRELVLDEAAAAMDGDALAIALLGALANEAARLLGEGAVARPGDLDLLALRAMGYARFSGAPLLQADLRGIFNVYKAMRNLGALSNLWVPHGRLTAMVNNGQGFFGRSPPGG